MFIMLKRSFPNWIDERILYRTGHVSINYLLIRCIVIIISYHLNIRSR